MSVSPTRSSETSFRPGDDVADLAGRELLERRHRRRHRPELLRLEAGAERHRAQLLARRERAVDDPHEGDDAAVLVVGRVEDQRPRRGGRLAGGCRDPRDDGVEHRLDAAAGLGRDPQHVPRVVAEELGQLQRDAVRVGLRQVDLVDDRNDLELVLDREVGVRERLRLDPLGRVDHEQRPLARLQRPRDLVGEVDVPGRVDQVQLVAPPARPARPGP